MVFARIASVIVLLSAIMAACSSTDEEGEMRVRTFPANECVTRGASYLGTYTEVSGNCGPIPDELFNVPPDGTLSTAPWRCNKVPRYEGCSVFLDLQTCTNYEPSYEAVVTREMTTKVIWQPDGSEGHGTMTVRLSAPGWEPCKSTYQVQILRQ